MPIDFGKISAPKPSKRPIDPIEIFRTLRVNDSSINDLWLAQGDSLREWNSNRVKNDTAIVLNTGAGKTLVGLLVAQSLANETNGKVVYACGSIQLVEQTAAKAAGYGLEVTTYFKGSFNNHLYQQGLAPCITTYQALFNGKSIFYRDNLAAIIFDDAHTAEHLIRDHFTLRISRSSFPDLFIKLSELFRAYYDRIGNSVGYAEMLNKQIPTSPYFIPPFALNEQITEVQRYLRDEELYNNPETLFAWEHLKDHIDLCACFIENSEISFTPVVIPINTLPYFKTQTRRLYLSATLPANDAFYRTFGRKVELSISPKTTAGECERLILIPSLNKKCGEDKEVIVSKNVIQKHKTLIIVPSYPRATQWEDIATLLRGDEITSDIDTFKAKTSADKIILVGRYDGIDLPGDSCRLMIIDSLPSGVGPLERFLWEQLGMSKTLRSMVASRIVQSFGRIFRGMSDHGVVVITGQKLVSWLLNPANQSALPDFLRRQLDLGIAISRQAETLKDLADAVNQCLKRDPTWINYYQENMATLAALTNHDDPGEMMIAEIQVNFGHYLWTREYTKAVKTLETALNAIFEISGNAGAWNALWLGYSYQLTGDISRAHQLYKRAHSAAKNIPPFEIRHVASGQQYSLQILEVAGYLDIEPDGFKQFLKKFDAALSVLKVPGSTVPQIEEAIRTLGEYLGLNSTRPEHEHGTGPDVLWQLAGTPSLCMEAKTDKTTAENYWKKDVSQLLNHIQWVTDTTGTPNCIPAFIGPYLPPADDSNPRPDMVVIQQSDLIDLAERLRAALIDISKAALPLTLQQEINDTFTSRKLTWPNIFSEIPKNILKNIKP
jgi:tetratricopeptide (TPR) repeat protein